MIKILIILSFINSLLIIKFNHPVSLLIIILMQTFLLILMMGMISSSFWFSYILFLVFVGGLLILFTYLVSLTYNNKFYIKMKNMNWIIIINISLFLMIYNNKNILFIFNNELKLNFKESFVNCEMMMNLIKLFNYPNNLITMFMIMYLFFMLIVIMKITNFYYGPLRIKYF